MARPRAQRINYGALRCGAPFAPDWAALWREGGADSAVPPVPATLHGGAPPTVSVVRGRRYAAAFAAGDAARGSPAVEAALVASAPPHGDTRHRIALPLRTPAPTLLRVRVTLWHRGAAAPGAALCAPSAGDLSSWCAVALRRPMRPTGSGAAAAVAGMLAAASPLAGWEGPT